MAVRLFTLAAIPAILLVGGCSGLWGHDELERYAQRTDRLTMSAGDAKEVNAVTHTNNPWPRGVEDRRIVADGARMQRAVERYRRGARPPDVMPDIPDPGKTFGTALPSEPPVSQARSSAEQSNRPPETGSGGGRPIDAVLPSEPRGLQGGAGAPADANGGPSAAPR